MAPPGVAAMAAFSVPGIRDVVAVPTASDSKGQSQRDTGERSRTRACPTGKCRWGCLDSPGGATPVTRINARGSVAVRWELESMSQAKLVRDKIPQIIRDTGAEPVTRVADVEEYRKLLRAKLVEEVEEFLSSDDPNELADVLEVLLALAGDLGVDQDQLEKLRRAKAFERGGFSNRIVWSGNTSAGGCVWAKRA